MKYGGYFKPINNGGKEKYYSGKQRTIYLDETCYSVEELFEEVSKFYLEDDSLKLSLLFVDKHASSQSFIKIEDDTSYRLMLSMYEEEKKVIIYVNAEKITTLEDGIRIYETVGTDTEIWGNEYRLEDIENGSDYCHSEDSYSSLDSETEDEIDIEYEGEFYSYDKDDPKMDVGAQYPHVIAFRRALSHYAITHDFEFDLGKSEPTRVTATCASRDCNWRIHAAVTEDGVTFVVRTLQEDHTCFRINRSGNKHANKAWIADRIIDDLRREGDLSAKELKRRVEMIAGTDFVF